MKIALVTAFLEMLFVMGTGASVQPQKNFDLQRFAGKWYRVGLAYDSPGFIPYRSRLTISMGIVEPKENGDVNMTMWTSKPSGCQRKVYIYEKTSVPGVFDYYSTRHKRVKDVTVVETNYTEYAMVFKHKKFNKEYTQVALYGRTKRLSANLMEKFRAYAIARGFSRESILTPPPAENCPSSGK
ncbi:prostaglandin D2 synthase a isoform X1 [Triplophysa rosa]|uniref:Prostaglandin D2 synthase a n=1 Tax=Triplophysa rosa TaxID=992332 RepID=A0A9W7T9Z7_TRIRA|nr:prostaglandin D2 synthase a isoform X1 [Triplophysa rosa]KAI7793370.1 prostaglandin D2 synthase a precursor [Triplophysa rosa]